MDIKHHSIPSLSKFKDDIFVFEPITRTVIQSLSFEDALTLMQSRPKIMLHPIDPITNTLRLVWRVFLDYHSQEFLENNSLYQLKRRYKWNFFEVQAIYAKLQQLEHKHLEEKENVAFVPDYYLPDVLASGEEINLFLYLILAFYAKYAQQIYFNDKHSHRHQISFVRDAEGRRYYHVWDQDFIHHPEKSELDVKRQAITKENRLDFARHLFIMTTNLDLKEIIIAFRQSDLPIEQKREIRGYTKAHNQLLRGSKWRVRFSGRVQEMEVIIKKK